MQRLFVRYTQALGPHRSGSDPRPAIGTSVEQQLCRWLLLTLDRLPSQELIITEWSPRMLGVRQEGVTEAAGKLQHAGFISYRRGHISVLERSGLETRSVRVLRRGQKGI